MYPLLFVLYVVAEIAVLAWLGSTLGALATVLIFLGVSAAGYLVLAALGRRALRNLGELRGGRAPHANSRSGCSPTARSSAPARPWC